MSKYEKLESVSLWIGRFSSPIMCKRYLSDLESYCEFHNKGPNELLEIKQNQKEPIAEKMLDKFAIRWKRPESVKANAVVAIRSFYSAHYLDLAKRAGSGTKYRRVKPIRNPTQDQLREMCLGAHIRDIAIINTLSSGGFRVDTLTRLNWSHVSEIESWGGIDPIHVPVMGKDLKGGGLGKYKALEQHAFLDPHAIRMLLKYRAWRESRGEKIGDNSPLFVSLIGKPTRLKTRIVRFILERICESKPFSFSPHDLRRFTQTQLEQGRIQPNWIKKMLGKTVSGEDDPYSRPKIDQLRDAFQGAIPFISLGKTQDQIGELERRKRTLLDLMSLFFSEMPDMLRIFENQLKKTETEQELGDFMRIWEIGLANGKLFSVRRKP